MNARCTICLQQNPYTSPGGNVKLRTVNGQDILVCRKHDPERKKHEPNSGKN